MIRETDIGIGDVTPGSDLEIVFHDLKVSIRKLIESGNYGDRLEAKYIWEVEISISNSSIKFETVPIEEQNLFRLITAMVDHFCEFLNFQTKG